MALTKIRASEMGKKSSRKGVPNKYNTEIREAFKNLIELSIPKMQKWLEAVAEENPAKALDVMAKMAEYVLPKLQKTEIESNITVNQLMALPEDERKIKMIEIGTNMIRKTS